MRFLADENLDAQIVLGLREAGHDVLYVVEMVRGISDEEVLSIAQSERAVVVTADKDFGELVFRRGFTHHGVLLVRLHGWSEDDKAAAVVNLVARVGSGLDLAFTVLDEHGVRTRTPS